MTDQYMRQVMKVVVAQISQTIGWHAIQSTPLELMADVLHKYLQEFTRDIARHVELYNRTEANLDDVALSVQNLNISLDDLMEYVTHVEPVHCAVDVPKFPARKESNLNFLKPGSKEVLTRPVHIYEHLPPIYPEKEVDETQPQPPAPGETNPTEMEASDNPLPPPSAPPTVCAEFPPLPMASDAGQFVDDSGVFKRPEEHNPYGLARPSSQTSHFPLLAAKRPRLAAYEEEGRPTREISSVMMTSSGFISPAIEGKLPDCRPPILPDFSQMEKHIMLQPPPPAHQNTKQPALHVSGLDNKFDKKSKKKAPKNSGTAADFGGGNTAQPLDFSPYKKKKQKLLMQGKANKAAMPRQSPFKDKPLRDDSAPWKPMLKDNMPTTKMLAPEKRMDASLWDRDAPPSISVTPIDHHKPAAKPPKERNDEGKLNAELDRNKLNIFKKISASKKERDDRDLALKSPPPMSLATEGIIILPSGTTITPTAPSANRRVYAPPPEDDQIICVDDDGLSEADGMDLSGMGDGVGMLKMETGKKARKHKKHKKERKKPKVNKEGGKRPVGRPSLDSMATVNAAPTREEFAIINKKLMKMDTVLKPAPPDNNNPHHHHQLAPPPEADPPAVAENLIKRPCPPDVPAPFVPQNFLNIPKMADVPLYRYAPPPGLFPFHPARANGPRGVPPFLAPPTHHLGDQPRVPFSPFLNLPPLFPISNFAPRPGLIPGPGLFGQYPPYLPPIPKKLQQHSPGGAPQEQTMPPPTPGHSLIPEAELTLVLPAPPPLVPKPQPTICEDILIVVSDDEWEEPKAVEEKPPPVPVAAPKPVAVEAAPPQRPRTPTPAPPSPQPPPPPLQAHPPQVVEPAPKPVAKMAPPLPPPPSDVDDEDDDDIVELSSMPAADMRSPTMEKAEGKIRKEHKKLKKDKEGKIKKKKEKSKSKEKSEKRKEKDEKKDKDKLRKLKKEKKKEKHRTEDILAKYTGTGPSTSAALNPPAIPAAVTTTSVAADSSTNNSQSAIKLTLKFGNNAHKSPTPDSMDGTSRKQMVKSSSSNYIDIDDDDDDDGGVVQSGGRPSKRDMSPELARISPLVTRPPKQKSISDTTITIPNPAPSVQQTIASSERLLSPVTVPSHDVRPQHPISFRLPSMDAYVHDNENSMHTHSTVTGYDSTPGGHVSDFGYIPMGAPIPPPPPIENNRPSSYIDAEGNEVWICPACGKVDDGTPMIGCDGCDAWYHWVCVGIQIPPGECEDWFCRVCIAKKQEEAHGGDKKRKKKKKGKQTSNN